MFESGPYECRNVMPAKVPVKSFGRTLSELGALRIALWILALITFALMPLPGTRSVYIGWQIVPTLVVPVLAPLIVMVLLLDALMSRVFIADAKAAARRPLRRALLINLAIAGLLLLRLIPYVFGLR
jgi:hypothetical protein